MLTEGGRDFLRRSIGGALRGAELFVSDGSQRAVAPLDDGFPQLASEGGGVVLQATFSGDAANFDWRERGVLVDGEIIDTATEDGGRKADGAIWTLRIVLDVDAP